MSHRKLLVGGCQVPGARCQVPGARCQVPGARCQVSGVLHNAQANVWLTSLQSLPDENVEGGIKSAILESCK